MSTDVNLRTKLPHNRLRVVKLRLEPPVGLSGLTPESLPRASLSERPTPEKAVANASPALGRSYHG